MSRLRVDSVSVLAKNCEQTVVQSVRVAMRICGSDLFEILLDPRVVSRLASRGVPRAVQAKIRSTYFVTKCLCGIDSSMCGPIR